MALAPLQGHVDRMKERPKDERQAVAIGTAGAVVLILIIGWAFLFLKGLRRDQVASGQVFDIPQDVSAAPVVQTYQTYDQEPQEDQFGLPR